MNRTPDFRSKHYFVEFGKRSEGNWFGQAFESLSKRKQQGFTVSRGKVDEGKIQKAYGNITRSDFDKFRKNTIKEAPQAVKDLFSNDRNGFYYYLLALLYESPMCEKIMGYEKTESLQLMSYVYMIILQMVEPSMSDYGKTLQGVMLNELAKVGRRAELVDDDDTMIQIGENVQLAFFRRDNAVAMTTPMQKVLSMYHEELCKVLPADLTELGKVTLDELGKYTKITITLDKYMELTKVKDKKEARKAIREACDRLFDIAFSVTVKKGKTDKTYKGRLFQSQMVSHRGGIYEMEFSNDFLRYCATTSPSAFHHGMYEINGNRFRYAWSIGQKLRQHYEINRGKPNANRLSVAKLLESVPDIPTYEEVMQGDKHIDRRIIEPVERDLDELRRLNILESWEYSNTKGIPLTKEQIDNMDYSTWSKLYITYTMNLPPQAHYIEQHKRRIVAAKKRAAVKRINTAKRG